MNKHKLKKYSALSLALISAGVVMPVFSQEEAKHRLEEIIVTATKRDTSLSNTPLAISAFNQESLDKNHIGNLFDMRGLAPGLEFQVDETQASHVVYIRGVGSNNSTEFGDPAAAFYVDGVFAGRTQGSLAMMYDLDRVEVLRGPQGTLFGRNSTAGAISLHTAKPSQEFDASVGFTLGSYDRQGYQVMLNTPVNDKWALRLASASDNRDGWLKYSNQPNSFTGIDGQSPGAIDMSSTRLSSLYMTDSVKWSLSYERYDNNNIPNATISEDQYEERNGQLREVTQSSPAFLDLNSNQLRTSFDWDLNDNLTFTYIGGYGTIDKKQTNNVGISLDTPEWDYEGTQHEIQLKNSDDNDFRWTAGVYSFEESLDNRFDIVLSGDTWDGVPVDPAGTHTSYIFSQRVRNESISAYVQGTYDVSEDFRVTAGARYSKDEKENNGGRALRCNVSARNLPLPAEVFPSPSSVPGALGVGECFTALYNDMKGEFDEPTYMLRTAYDLNDDVLLFATFSTGYKAGLLQDGLPANADNSAPSIEAANALVVSPEFVDSFEIGVKASLLDGTLQLNSNFFLMDYDDLQVSTVVFERPGDFTSPSFFVTDNAATSEVKGLELEMEWEPNESDRFEVSATVLSAKYDEFDGRSTVIGNNQGGTALFNTCLGEVQPNNSCSNDAFDYHGNSLPFASDFTLATTYSHSFGLSEGGLLTPRIKVYYNSGFFASPDNIGDRPAGTTAPDDPGGIEVDEQAAYTKIDASLTYTDPSDQWSVEAFVTNLTDEAIKNRFDDFGTPKFVYQAPRQFGLRIKYDW